MEIDQKLQQRIDIKFLVKLGKNGPEIHQMLQQVYGECALKERTVCKWVQRFREGREDPKDDARSGRPSTSSGNKNIDRVHSLVFSDRRLTVRMIAEELGFGKVVRSLDFDGTFEHENGLRQDCTETDHS